MALFQQSVVNKYIGDLNQEKLRSAYQAFQIHFSSPIIQKNIREAKEEEYQEGFVRDLFVNVFNYILKPQPSYNFVLEKKNEKDSKKSDGAILVNQNVLGVVELKGTDTIDLGKVEDQAFNYKNNQKGCSYVITSNFEKLRIYIHDAVDFEEFNLFQLSFERFALLYCCLQKDQLIADIPAKIKKASIAVEETITKKLYSDYSLFKRELFLNIVDLNPAFNKLILFQKTQKLLDRILFILFAEDRLLLPPNSVLKIINDWEQLKDLDAEVPLYDRFKKYFGYLNTGHAAKEHEIFAYNGGLFASDDVLDNILLNDTILAKGCITLSNYDFETEVDTNILGHIFEHSLNEIEEVQAELEGKNIDKSKTRRKKDGVFYTPTYITKYMVDSTVGKLCTEKKIDLAWIDEEFIPHKRKAKRKQLLEKLEIYRKWLLRITILDPACGSGAFLNQALNFLIKEHRLVDELKARLFADSIVYSDIENVILENNIFGVDINEEAVEIAKLSLWLRTAKKGRKLNSLSKNILCGDSIVSDPEIAYDKAFNWKMSFPQIFDKGGFDVVIGNPPYVDIKSLNNTVVDYLFKEYSTANNRINLFAVFIEKSVNLLNQEGVFSFIIPSSLLTQGSYKELRKHLLEKIQINSIVRLPNESFGAGAGEVKVDTIILNYQKDQKLNEDVEVIVYKGFDRISEIVPTIADFHFFTKQKDWQEDEEGIFRINLSNSLSGDIISKIEKNSLKLIQCADFALGITPYDKYRGHTPEQITNQVFHASYQKDATFKKLLAGNDITRYNINWNKNEWISYGEWLGAPREKRFFTQKRILVKQIIDWSAKRIWAGLAEDELYNTQNAFNLIPKNGYLSEYLLAILNSRLMTFYHRKKFLEEFKDRFQKILIKDCKEFPIKDIDNLEQEKFVELVTTITNKTLQWRKVNSEFIKILQVKFRLAKISHKIEYWFENPFDVLIKELEKQKLKLSLSEQSEWMRFYDEQKLKSQLLKESIVEIDRLIDKKIYEIYDLNAEEIMTIEELFLK